MTTPSEVDAADREGLAAVEHLYEELQDEGDEEEALPPRQAAWASRAVSVRSARSTTSQDPLMDAWHLLGGPTLFDELVDPYSAQVAVDLAKQGLSDGTEESEAHSLGSLTPVSL